MTPERGDAGDRRGQAGRLHLSRRQFLGYTGAGGALLLLRDGVALRALAGPKVAETFATPVTFTRSVRRREDFLSLTFEFRNLVLDGSKPRRLVKASAQQPAYLTVIFPPQHVSDAARTRTELGTAPHDPDAPGAIQSRLSGPSRLAFEVPSLVLPMTFDIQTLLDWVFFPLRVPVLGRDVPPPAQITEPGPTETAIELPWHLVLSPRTNAGWAHSRTPVTRPSFAVGDRTELWHTRLATRKFFFFVPSIDEHDPTHRTVRAVWSRDAGFPGEPTASDNVFLSLTPDQRYDIVHLSSTVADRRPIQVNRLMLSSLGGWLDSRGEWDPPEGHAVEEWRHRATMGRDSYVRVVEQGFLAPFGFRAAKVTISERQFHTVPGHPRGAYLVQRQFIVVRERFKDYTALGSLGPPKGGRACPFRAVEITTLSTPDLQLDGDRTYFPLTEDGAEDVIFDLIGVDWEGQRTEFSAPLMWVRKDAVLPPGDMKSPQQEPNQNEVVIGPPDLAAVQTAYNTTSKRTVATSGQKIAFAPAKKGGETSFSAEQLVFQVQTLAENVYEDLKDELEAAGLPPIFPLLEEAKVRLSAVTETAGDILQDLVDIGLDPGFVDFGLEGMFEDAADNALALAQNAGEIFLDFLGDSLPIEFGDAAKSGGIVTPNFDLSAFSRELGPVGGVLEDLRAGKFDPKSIFDLASAKLLGQLKLGDILALVEESHGLFENGPTLQNLIEPKPPALPQRLITKLDWAPDLQGLFGGKGDPLGIFDTLANASLTIKAEAITNLADPESSTFSVEGLLRNIKLNLIGPKTFITIEVKQIRFTVGKGQPPDIDPQLGEIHFAGPLTFVEEMKNFLSSLGKGYGIDVQPTGIKASLSLPLPAISVGVFSLQNLSISIGAVIPFTGDPARFSFYFCSRENPFILTVSMFGGGGFFGLECGTDKSVMLEIALEFGAAVAFDIGVASGGVEVMAGFYIKVENEDALLSGYLRMGGELSILGIVRISMELYLGFEYHTKSRKCIGEARFYLEIEILFITIPVKATVRRAFGGEGDPTFAQLMAPDDWTEYCNAYATLETA